MSKYSAAQFIKAIAGTGGIISAIAQTVGCDWHTARKYIDEMPTVNAAWRAERERINDKAKHNLINAIVEGDLQTSKWWVGVMDEEFIPKSRTEVTGKDGGAIVLDWGDNDRE